MKLSLKKILAAFLAFALMITAVQWDNLSIVKAEETGRTSVSAKDDDWSDYLLLNRYQDSGDMFGAYSQGDMRYDYPSLYEEMYGIYNSSLQDKANRWNYIATKVNAEKDGQYRISVSVKSGNTSAVFKTFGMIVDGAMYVLEVSSSKYETLSQDIYLTAGEHVIIFTTPMPRDAKSAVGYASSSTAYPYFDMYSFTVSVGLEFVSAPSTDDVKGYMTSYQRVEAENTDYVLYNKNYGTSSTVTYTTRNNVGVTSVVGASGCDISDDTVSDGETNINTTQTYESLATYLDKKVTSYAQYSVKAEKTGTYNIRIGAYVEGSGTMPYGTVLVNDKAYKAQFSGNWNGMDAVNLAVELEAGVNIIRLVGVTADQTDSVAWIGYDFLEVQKGLEIVAPGSTNILPELSSYLVSNNYSSTESNTYGGAVTSTLRTDFPSIETLQEVSFTKLGNWPWAGMKVNAPYDGFYDISFYMGTDKGALSAQIGMIIDGDRFESKGYTIGTDAKQILNASTWLTKGEHTLVFTTPMPATQEIINNNVTSDTVSKYYPWMNFYGASTYWQFSLGGGLEALDPDASLINDTVGIEAENTEYVTYSDGFSVKKYPGTSSGQIVAGVTSDSQLSSYADINKDYIEWDKTDFVQFAINAEKAGNYDITLGVVSTRESNEIIEAPKAALLVNGKKYEVTTATWGKVSNITIADVALNQGNNIIMCTSATNDVAGTMISFDYFGIEEGNSFVAIADLKTKTEIAAGDETRVLPNLYVDNGTTLGGAASDATYKPERNAKISIEGLTTDKLYIVPYAAIKATASYSGYYDISLKFSSMRQHADITKYANNIGVLIDGKVYPVQFSGTGSATVQTSIYLEAGTHTIVFTAPMPLLQETANNTNIAENNRYPWADMGSITLYGLNVEDGLCPTITEAESHPEYIRIEAEDTESGYVIYNKYDSIDSSTIASGRKLMGGISEGNDIKENYSTLAGDANNQGYLVKSGMPYIQYAVNAPHTEGVQNYKIRVAYFANYSTTKPYIAVLVNDSVYKAEFTGASDTIGIVELEVGMKPGINVIRCTSHTLEQTSTCGWINQDFLDVDKRLTLVPQGTQNLTAVGGNETLTKYAKYTAQSDGSLGNANTGNIRTDAPSIETLKQDGMVNLLSRWPYVAMKVNAKVDGYYDISAYVDVRTDALSHQIGMLVDGQVYCMPYAYSASQLDSDSESDAIINASVYLTKGAHVLIFTSPMPKTSAEAAKAIADAKQSSVYPWFNLDYFTLSTGLEVLELTDDELTASVKTRVEAEDEKKATYNIYTKESNSSASNSYVVGGVSKTNLIQTLEDASKYMDKYSTPYVQYAINAPEDGTYLVNVRSYVGGTANDDYALTDVAAPYVGVWVNGESTKAQFTAWNAFNNAVVEVALKEGINYVRVMGLTTEQDCVSKISCYVNHDYIEVESGLTVVAVSELAEIQEFSAAKSDTILSNNYTNNGTSLGSADCDDMKYDRVSVESLANSDLGRIAYAAVKITASENGYYDFAVNIQAKSDSEDGSNKISKQVGMIVDGVQVNPAYLKGDGKAHTIGSTIYLEKGTHIVVFTSPLPMDNASADALYYPGVGATDGWTEMNFAYPWCNYNTITVDGRLNVETAPLKEEISDSYLLIGDANDDGELNSKDDETLRKYMVDSTKEINLEAADVTGTGLYDCKNLVALIKVVENAATSPAAYVSDHRAMLTRQNADYITTYSADDLDESTGTVIEINTETTKQEVHGFGASFTDSSALVLNQMGDEARENVLTSLFDEEKGIGLSMIRNAIGSSDFSTEYYTFQDDPNGEFALAGGQTENILKYTERALELNPDTKVFLAPWTAPIWMKTGASAKASDYPGTDEEWKYTSASGATLNTNYYSAYAQYLANTVKVYEEDYKIPVYAISAQNEPFTSNYWPGMNWGQNGNVSLKNKWVSFIENDFKSAIKTVSSDTKILNLDYNFYNYDEAQLLTNKGENNPTDAIAFHWYKDEPEVMEKFTGELMYVTEASSSYSDNNVTSQLEITQKIVRSLRSGASGFIMWNIALYPEGGPTKYDINEHCSPLVSYDYNDVNQNGINEIEFTKDYYALAHFSKFMDTNAVVVDSTNTAKTSANTTSYELVNVVTKNPDDGSMTAVIVNSDNNESKICKLVSDEKVMEVNVAPRSTVTITWNPNN